jgi:hypothetical protein
MKENVQGMQGESISSSAQRQQLHQVQTRNIGALLILPNNLIHAEHQTPPKKQLGETSSKKYRTGES